LRSRSTSVDIVRSTERLPFAVEVRSDRALRSGFELSPTHLRNRSSLHSQRRVQSRPASRSKTTSASRCPSGFNFLSSSVSMAFGLLRLRLRSAYRLPH
jgi:hypothetical protein